MSLNRMLRYLAPNLVTSLGMVFGLLSIVAALEQRFADAHYAGIELELNQGLLTPADTFPQPLVEARR